jgi:hypothetical protein
MHDKIQILLEGRDVVALHMLQHTVHDVQVRDLVCLLVLRRLNLKLLAYLNELVHDHVR